MLPQKVQKGQPITADLLNNIIDSIRECQLQSGTGYSFSRSAGGTTLSIRPSKQGAMEVQQQCPFTVSLGSPSGGQLKVKVSAGTVNGIYATNYADLLTFDSSPISVSVTGTHNIALAIATDGRYITAFEIVKVNSITAMIPTTPLAPTSFNWPIAHINDAVVYGIVGCSSLNAVLKESCRIAKTPSTPDDNAYDIFYYWILQ